MCAQKNLCPLMASIVILVLFGNKHVTRQVSGLSRGLNTNTSSNSVLPEGEDVSTLITSSVAVSGTTEHSTWADDSLPRITEIDNRTENTTQTDRPVKLTEVQETNSTSSGDKREHSGFNLALIPVAAAVIFTIAGCLKCCQWFRRYTRGGSKDESYYAVIVEDGDDGHVDMAFDTVSSYSSFLRRSENANVNSVTPIKSLKSETAAEFTDSPKRWLFSKFGYNRAIGGKRECGRLGDGGEIPLRKTHRTRHHTTSISSEETEVDLSSSDASVFKKHNSFKVSFVIDSYTSKVENMPSDKSSKPSDKAVRQPEVQARALPREKAQMVTVATQTNKTFRQTMKQIQVRRLHDSNIEKEYVSPAKARLLDSTDGYRSESSTKCRLQDTQSVQCVQHCTQTEQVGSVYSSSLPEAHTVPFPSGCKIRGISESSPFTSVFTEAEFSDDVFDSVADVTPASLRARCACNHNANVELNSSFTSDTAAENIKKNSFHCGMNSVAECPPAAACETHIVQNQCSSSLPHETGKTSPLSHSCGPTVQQYVATTATPSDINLSCSVTHFPHDTDSRVSTELLKSSLTDKAVLLETHCKPNVDRVPARNSSAEGICYTCGMSLRGSRSLPKRYNSEMSDNRSSSVTSLESSGYAEELSFDGSD